MTLEDLIKDGVELSKNTRQLPPYNDYYVTDVRKFAEWTSTALMYLQEYYPNHSQTKRFETYVENGETLQVHCIAMVSILKAFSAIQPTSCRIEYDQILGNIFENFHRCAKQLQRRYDSRNTMEIKDEYDVQDFLNVLLKLHFDDVRPEEWAPSYAGGCNRMDFLLKDEEIAIEVKMTRKGLKDKEVGEQLIVDTAEYKSHPNCKTLYCFVYDPEEYIRNPRRIEKDLSGMKEGIDVKVFIRPQS